MTGSVKKTSALNRAAARAVSGYFRFVWRTSTVVIEPAGRIDELREHTPMVMCFWHGQFMLIPQVRPTYMPTDVMVARHDDADILSAVMANFDLGLIRGAGAGARKRDRGGATALRQSLKALKSGTSIGMTADVPPGPARKVGIGVVTIARMSGRPVLPVAVASSRFHVFNTWSRLTLNLPFSRIGVAIGDPIPVPRAAEDADIESVRTSVEASLNVLTQQAYEIAGALQNKRAPISNRPTSPGLAAKAYKTVTRALEPLGPRILNRRAARGKEDTSRQNERLGSPSHPRPEGRLVWFHAASVGELNAVTSLLTEIKVRYPNLTLLVTTGTITSARIAETKLGGIALHQFVPIDGPRMVQRFLDHWRPEAAFFVESEIWPNLVYETADRGIPLLLVNARMSARSAKAWRKPFRARTAASLFSCFTHILAQTPADLTRFTRLGSANVEVVGNLKIDNIPPVPDEAVLTALKSQIGDRKIFLAASTHPGEDEQVADAHTRIRKIVPDALTIIVPRHPERGTDIHKRLDARGLTVALRSTGTAPIPDTDIYVADTLGELGLFFSLANVTFMGGSLVPHGGQNPIEPIRFGCPVITGPHTHNFEDIVTALTRFDGILVAESANDLADKAVTLMSDAALRDATLKGADDALAGLGGAFEKTLARIAPYLAGQSTASNPHDKTDAT